MTPVLHIPLFVSLLAAPPFDTAVWLESFDKVWTTVRDNHYDPKLKGVDWEKARTELRPKVAAATSPDEARKAMRDLLSRLGESHHGIVPKEVYGSDDRAPAGTATAGLELRLIGNAFLVTRIESDSPAAAAGIQTGWTLRRIGDTDLTTLHARGTLRAELGAASRLRGSAGDTRTLQFDERTVMLQLAEPVGTKLARFGNLPPVPVRFESRLLDTARPTGYLRIASFFDPEALQTHVNHLIDTCAAQNCQGIVIDIRGNPGGLGMLAATVTGWFIPEPAALGTLRTRTLTLKLAVTPRPNLFRGPVAVLQDGHSMSTSEILAGGLQDLGRARIFGTQSAGAALPSQFLRLPSGDALQYVTASYVSHGGKPLEGAGVTPDQKVAPTREALLQGHDEILEAALAWLSIQSSKEGVQQ